MVVEDEYLKAADLVDFGRRAKNEVLTKDLAYDLAVKLGVPLSEHGGTGDGVIGAVAGSGLRLQAAMADFAVGTEGNRAQPPAQENSVLPLEHRLLSTE